MPVRIEKCEIDRTFCNEFNEVLIGYWIAGEWTNNCDEDICSSETRSVVCSDINAICDIYERPLSEKKCELSPGVKCGTWKTEAWNEVIFPTKISYF